MVEAMACGTPVVAFGRGWVPEVERDGETGFVVATIDEAVAALPLVAALDRAGIRAYTTAHFSRERMVDDYLRLYAAILEQHERRQLVLSGLAPSTVVPPGDS